MGQQCEINRHEKKTQRTILIDDAYVLRSPGDTEEASSGMCVLDTEEVGQSTQARKEEPVLSEREGTGKFRRDWRKSLPEQTDIRTCCLSK